jgi:hypothetical protein
VQLHKEASTCGVCPRVGLPVSPFQTPRTGHFNQWMEPATCVLNVVVGCYADISLVQTERSLIVVGCLAITAELDRFWCGLGLIRVSLGCSELTGCFHLSRSWRPMANQRCRHVTHTSCPNTCWPNTSCPNDVSLHPVLVIQAAAYEQHVDP